MNKWYSNNLPRFGLPIAGQALEWGKRDIPTGAVCFQ